MNLLTVTYEEDLERSLIQAESIQKFVTNPTNYYIFINEAHDVCERLRHHFKQFKCTILTRDQMEIACDYVNSLGIKVQLKQAVCREIETFILKPVDNT